MTYNGPPYYPPEFDLPDGPPCPDCEGTGDADGSNYCHRCGGSGEVCQDDECNDCKPSHVIRRDET